MGYPFIKRKELAERWKVSTATVDRMANDGVIKRAGFGKFRIADIEEYEHSQSRSKLITETFLERRQKIEIENLKAENQHLKQTMYQVVELLAKFLQEDVQKKQ